MRQIRYIVCVVIVLSLVCTAAQAQASAEGTSDSLPLYTSVLSNPGVTDEGNSLRAALDQAHLPSILLGAAAVCLLILLFLFYRRNRSEGARLERLVQERTTELNIAANERRQTLNKMEAVVRNYKGIIWSIDTDRIITTYNGQHLRKMGIMPCSVEGKHIDSMDRPDHISMYEGVEKTFSIGPQDWINEINGRSFHSHTLPIYDDDGNIIGVVGSTDDVTEEMHLRRKLEQAAVEAEATSRAKSAFLANMSHEIRTPMNSIVGFSELALDDSLTPRTREHLEQILENSKWLLQILNDILDISKVESGKMDIENVPFELGEILAHCQSVIAPKAKEKNIQVQFYAEPFIGRMLLGDPTRLRQVIVNILSNAIKFTHIGSVKASATVAEMTDSNCTVLFEIRDSGIGMTPSQIEKVFTPFMQAESSTTRKYGGTGLGLPITKDIIELMGGKLEVESTPGLGSKFSFRLTFDTMETPVDPGVHTYSVGDIEKPIFSSDTIVLVCEDNEMNQRVIQEHLKRVRIKTVIAENGRIGVDLVKSRRNNGEKPFDLIFMDIYMPEMDGLEAAQSIVHLNVGSPIIALTANVMSNDREQYYESGMDDCMSKPFTSQELWAFLLKYLKPEENTGAYQKDIATTEESENEFQTQLKLDFYKANVNRFSEFTSALNANDVQLAHRLSHTLKSNATLIGCPRLQAVAAEIEKLLADGVNHVQKWHIEHLSEELETVLRDLAPLLEYAEKPVRKVETLDKTEAIELFRKLKPLLISNNTDCLNFIDDLRGVEGSETLVEQIENFEFIPAAETLAGLEQKMEDR